MVYQINLMKSIKTLIETLKELISDASQTGLVITTCD